MIDRTFVGPTEKQREEMKKQEEYEQRYMQWLYDYRKQYGSDPCIEDCNFQYNLIRANLI